MNKVKGTYDVLPNESFKWQFLESKVRNILSLYGYSEVRTPLFEYSEVFHRQNEQSDMVTKETYDFLDKGNRSLTLRPEGTAGVIRCFIENKLYVDNPVSKLFYIGPNFRYENPQKGRYRQFSQFGVEAIGSNDPAIDAETITLAYHFIEDLGLKGVKVRINTLGDNDSKEAYKQALISHFTPHVDSLCQDCKNRIHKNPLRILDCKIDHAHEAVISAPTTKMLLNETSKKYFETVLFYLDQSGIRYEVADKLVRGLDYYSHTVFEIEANIEGFGAQNVLGGGGRYQNLVKELGGPDLPGIGFAFGMERLLMAIESEHIVLPLEPVIDVFFIALDSKSKAVALHYLLESRNQGLKCDMYYGEGGFKAQIKAGLKQNAKYLAILGESEREKGVIGLKDTLSQEQIEIPLDSLLKILKEKVGK